MTFRQYCCRCSELSRTPFCFTLPLLLTCLFDVPQVYRAALQAKENEDNTKKILGNNDASAASGRFTAEARNKPGEGGIARATLPGGQLGAGAAFQSTGLFPMPVVAASHR